MSSLKKILETIKNIYAKITNLQTKITALESKTAETEWTTCTMQSGFTNGALASAGNLMYMKTGKLVCIKGSCKGFNSDRVTCAQLPEGYRPSTRIDFYAGTSSNRIAKAMITSGGYIQLLADTNVNANFDENQWYSFCTAFVAEQ